MGTKGSASAIARVIVRVTIVDAQTPAPQAATPAPAPAAQLSITASSPRASLTVGAHTDPSSSPPVHPAESHHGTQYHAPAQPRKLTRPNLIRRQRSARPSPSPSTAAAAAATSGCSSQARRASSSRYTRRALLVPPHAGSLCRDRSRASCPPAPAAPRSTALPLAALTVTSPPRAGERRRLHHGRPPAGVRRRQRGAALQLRPGRPGERGAGLRVRVRSPATPRPAPSLLFATPP